MITVIQSLICIWLFVSPWTAALQASLYFKVFCSLLKHMSIKSVMLFNHLILCCPLILLPSIFPSIRSFPMSWLFASCGQSIGASASTSVLPMNIQSWFPLKLTGLISLLSKGLSSLLQHHSLKASTFTSIHDYWKNHSFPTEWYSVRIVITVY